MNIPFAKVNCDGAELQYVQQVLASGWLTTAGKAMEFERRFAAAVGARHACAVNSCTAALHLALEAVGIGPGDEVLVPTLTFTATAEIIRYLGADPVFADVEYGTGLLTPETVEEALQKHPGIKAVMIVHFGGQAAQMTGATEDGQAAGRQRTEDGRQRGKAEEDSRTGERQKAEGRRQKGESEEGGIAGRQKTEDRRQKAETGQRCGILDVCRARGVRVIEDAAHAFPTRLNGRMVGSFGDATCFSFYANKTITTGEGGMLVTDDPAIHARAKVMRLHGIDRDIWNRFTSDKPSWEYDVVAPGFKYNMPDVNAAIGLAQLERADQMRAERQRCFEFYLRELGDCKHLDLPVIRGLGGPSALDRPSTLNSQLSTALQNHSCHLFWVVLKEGAPVTRNRLIQLLSEAGIGTSVHYKPLHRMTYYRERYRLRPEDFPNAEKHWKGCFSLPVYPSLSDQELVYVVRNVRECVGRGEQVPGVCSPP